LTLACVTASLFAQSTTKAPAAKTPRGTVSGRVTIKEKPAPGIVVGLRKGDLVAPFEPFSRAVTDADGVYRITNLAPGTYQISAAAPGYVPADLPLRGDPTGRKDVVVGEDENVEGINFSLVRGGVITGKVTDAEGRPVVQQQVEIYPAALLDQRTAERPAYPQTTGQTDDRGIYRVFGLPAGRYKVSAGRGEEGYGGYSPTQASYRQVFHPDVSDPTKATVVEVTEGSEANNVDITLGRKVQTYSVSGHVINTETGLPIPNTRFGLQRLLGQRFEFVNSSVMSNARGDFIVEGLIPGKYGVVIFANDQRELRAEASTFEVADQDLTDVAIKFARGASISGVVVLESDDKAALAQLRQLQMRGFVQNMTGYASSASSPIAADGSFRLSGLASGPINMSLGALTNPYPPKGFSISRIERDGVVSPRIQVKDGEQLTGVKVFIGYGTATLRGVVNIENGTLPSNTRVFLRLTKPGENTSYLRPPPVDDRGHFFLDGIPAGVYELTAYIVGSIRRPPGPIKREVTLTDGAVTDVIFTIDLATLTTQESERP
jgi:5-hydroxyisourate hydrolase-like protein (transthyretin family)